MAGWLSQRCPLITSEKTWTERRMKWLADQFGIERLLDAQVILPSDEFFPDPYTPDEAGVRRLLERICDYMEVRPAAVELEICDDEQMPGAAGHYEQMERTTIRVAASQLQTPGRLVATLAHELSHFLLLGQGLLRGDESDHEWVTDLLPVFLGLGVFSANAVISEASGQIGHMSWWTMSRQGYLPARVLGYGLGLFAYMRGEREPVWARHLRADAAVPLREGIRYIHDTGDCLFHPDTFQEHHSPRSRSELLERLVHRSATVRLSALLDLRDQPESGPEVVEALSRCLNDCDPCIPGAAAQALGCAGAAAAPAIPQLIVALRSSQSATRGGAAEALGLLKMEAERVVPELMPLLKDERRGVVLQTVGALRAFETKAEQAVSLLLDVLQVLLIECEYMQTDLVLDALLAVTPELKDRIREHFAHDPEMRRLALEAWRERRHALAEQEMTDA